VQTSDARCPILRSAIPSKSLRRAAVGRSIVGLAALAAAVALSACVATKYQMTGRHDPPVLLDLNASQPPLVFRLRATIVYNGPGSWKQDALWDEYVATVQNQGDTVMSLTEVALVDLAGSDCRPGNDPWALEKESQSSEERYRRTGVAFARGEIPQALISGAGAATAASGGAVAGGVATVAAASVVALPVYYVVVWGVNYKNRAAVNAEFARRRMALPVTLAVGETRTGSFFFPMTPSPQSLRLRWSSGSAVSEVALSLKPLQGLHGIAPPPN